MSYKFLKSILDILVGFFGAVVTAPILLLLFLLIKLESKGPFIFKQMRVGKGCKEFGIFKVRTMYHTPQNSGNYFTSSNDKRVTRIGNILRKTSLDELPQFWNLLLGQMSLIGPRPDLAVQKKDYSDTEWSLRHTIKPGITGLAQSSRRSQSTHKRRLTLDLFYVRHYSLGLDLVIIYRTFKIIFKKGVQN